MSLLPHRYLEVAQLGIKGRICQKGRHVAVSQKWKQKAAVKMRLKGCDCGNGVSGWHEGDNDRLVLELYSQCCVTETNSRHKLGKLCWSLNLTNL